MRITWERLVDLCVYDHASSMKKGMSCPQTLACLMPAGPIADVSEAGGFGWLSGGCSCAMLQSVFHEVDK